MRRIVYCLSPIAYSLLLVGCAVSMNSEYSTRLDTDAARATVWAAKAADPNVTSAEIGAELARDANEYQAFLGAHWHQVYLDGTWRPLLKQWLGSTRDDLRRAGDPNTTRGFLTGAMVHQAALWNHLKGCREGTAP